MLALMPFPALNPWNWGAITPTAAVATGIAMTRIGLSAWRAYADASRAIFREREEAMLKMAESMVAGADESAAVAEGAAHTAPRTRRASARH
jgi:hypothetical protein